MTRQGVQPRAGIWAIPHTTLIFAPKARLSDPSGQRWLLLFPYGTEAPRAGPISTYLPLVYPLSGQHELLSERGVQHLESPAELREPHVVSVAWGWEWAEEQGPGEETSPGPCSQPGY